MRTDNASRGPVSCLTATASPPRNVGPNRHSRRGLVAVLSPLRSLGPSPRSAQPCPCSSLEAGVFRGDLLGSPCASRIGSPAPSVGGEQGPGSPSAASNIHHRLGTTRCVVGSRRQDHRDALSVRSSRMGANHFSDRPRGDARYGVEPRSQVRPLTPPLQRETGVTRATIMRFVRGDQSIRLDMADRLAAYFRLTLTLDAESVRRKSDP